MLNDAGKVFVGGLSPEVTQEEISEKVRRLCFRASMVKLGASFHLPSQLFVVVKPRPQSMKLEHYAVRKVWPHREDMGGAAASRLRHVPLFDMPPSLPQAVHRPESELRMKCYIPVTFY